MTGRQPSMSGPRVSIAPSSIKPRQLVSLSLFSSSYLHPQLTLISSRIFMLNWLNFQPTSQILRTSSEWQVYRQKVCAVLEAGTVACESKLWVLSVWFWVTAQLADMRSQVYGSGKGLGRRCTCRQRTAAGCSTKAKLGKTGHQLVG